MDNVALIVAAINSKSSLSAYYNGHFREICPHVIGTKNGKLQSLMYQFGGTSSSGPITSGHPSNWRCVEVNKLEDLQLTTKGWHTAGNHSQTQTCVDSILAEVDY